MIPDEFKTHVPITPAGAKFLADSITQNMKETNIPQLNIGDRATVFGRPVTVTSVSEDGKTVTFSNATGHSMTGDAQNVISAPEAPRGLRASIYKDKGRDWSNSGLSSTVDEVTIIGEGIPPIFEATPDAPAVRVVSRRLFGGRETYVHIEPQAPGQYMMGGCFIHTSDSRFRELVNRYPVALHDRQELSAAEDMKQFAHAPGPAKIRV